MRDHVGRDEPARRTAAGGEVAGGRGRRGGGRRLQTLGEERRDHARQHVARAGRRERRRPERDDEHALAGRGDERVGSLQEADAAEALRRLLHRLEPVRVDPGRLAAEQPAELARVRSQHRRRGPLERLEPEEPVGVDDRRQRRSPRAGAGRAPAARVARPRPGPSASDPCRGTASTTSSSGRLTASSSRDSITGSDSGGAQTVT